MASPVGPVSPRPPPVAGWYPDPAGSHSLRYSDGARWTDALSSAVPPASPTILRDDARAWALASHLSPLLALLVGLPFLGPLAVYLARKDDPFVRRHAAGSLNFNLSFSIYAVVLGIATVFLIPSVAGIFLIAACVLLAIVWLVCICIAVARAGQGRDFRYPLTIRFVT